MSIELNVYANRDVLMRELLARECNSPDLPEEMRWEIVFLPVSDDSPHSDQKGKLTEDQRVAGWPITSKKAGEVQNAILRNDKQALSHLYEAGEYGQLDLFVSTKGSREWSLNDPDVLEEFPEEHRAAAHHSTCRYSVETHASRNDMSLEFQQFLWRMIGVLTFGLLEDPQEGTYEDCAEDDSKA